MQAYILPTVSMMTLGKDVCVAVYFVGCDFKCPFCFTPHLLQSYARYLIDLREIQKLIEQHKPYITTVLLTGGEPLLQRPAAVALAQLSKKLGLRVAVHTNGSKPSALKSLVEAQLVDLVIWDLKAPPREDLFEQVTKSKTFFVSTATILNNVQEMLDLLIKSKSLLDIEVRTTIVPGLLYKKEDLFAMAQFIAPLQSKWILQPFNPYKELESKTLQGVHEPSDEFMKTLRDVIMKEFPAQWVEVHTLEDNYLKDLVVEQ